MCRWLRVFVVRLLCACCLWCFVKWVVCRDCWLLDFVGVCCVLYCVLCVACSSSCFECYVFCVVRCSLLVGVCLLCVIYSLLLVVCN